ncbi:MAG TPA: type VI secretion system accessory protein TagJ [Candidatus Polarisedimenticolia bacterium]|nr:type VI secretion system accessory protein TagJ [Candidatus Polarisedimenticolia bacterium]
MLAEESFRAGKLQESLAQLQEQIRAEPSNSKYRVFLFQLLAVMGQWERALTQLKVLGEMDAGTLAMVQAYRDPLKCEGVRAGVFSGAVAPTIFGEPEHWMALQMEALKLAAKGHYAQSRQLRDEAFELAPSTPGTIDGKAFEWIADADARLGPMLEAIVNGRYYWIPFHRIRKIRIEEPADMRDMVWTPVHFEWANGGEMVGMIPTRYPGSEASDDAQIRMARKTEWMQRDEETFLGLGQRMLSTNEDEYPLIDIRSIELIPAGGEDKKD